MADNLAAAILNPEVVLALINLVRSLLERSTSQQNNDDFRTNLTIVHVDLGMVNDVLKVIQRRNRRNLPDGIRIWKEEAQSVVADAQALLRRIDGNNQYMDDPETTNSCWPSWNKKALRHTKQDVNELANLRIRLDNITKHNDTVLQLLGSCGCFPLCC